MIYVSIETEKRTPRQLSVDSFIPIEQQERTTKDNLSTTTTTTATVNNGLPDKQQQHRQVTCTSSQNSPDNRDPEDDNLRHSHVTNDTKVTSSKCEEDEFSNELDFESPVISEGGVVSTDETEGVSTKKTTKRLSPDSLRMLETE